MGNKSDPLFDQCSTPVAVFFPNKVAPKRDFFVLLDDQNGVPRTMIQIIRMDQSHNMSQPGGWKEVNTQDGADFDVSDVFYEAQVSRLQY